MNEIELITKALKDAYKFVKEQEQTKETGELLITLFKAEILVKKCYIPAVSGSVCPKCGCTDYEEWEELEYEKGGDDPMYGGALVPMKFTRCGGCD